MTFSGGSIVTSDAIADAILTYTTSVADIENSVTIDITVLEDDGETSVHTLLLSTNTQFDVAHVGGFSEAEENERFPLPEMPQVGIAGKVETGGQRHAESERYADMMQQIDDGLGS